MTTLNSEQLAIYRTLRRRQIQTSRSESDRYPHSIYPERYGRRAAHCLAMAKEIGAADRIKPEHGEHIWRRSTPQNGQRMAAYGESAARWIENPEAMGLRFVGLAHDAAPAGYAYARAAVDHCGWYVDEFQSETVAGVVYRLPGKNGRARYLYGYADPWNTDKDGRGPALLSMSIVEGDKRDSDWDSDDGLRDAARYADGMAELMAEESREHDEAWCAGQDAREKAAEMRDAARIWADDMRSVREFFAMRHAAPGSDARRSVLRTLIRSARKSCETMIEAREAFVNAIDNAPRGNLRDTWREGYDNAA